MITVRIESDQSLKPESRKKLKVIFERSKDLKKDLSEAFSKGFTKFDTARFVLTLGRGSRVISFIKTNGFQPEAIAGENTIIKNTRYEVDY